jgi:DNA-binding transcriptional regulator LsrR (DeoR family)
VVAGRSQASGVPLELVNTVLAARRYYLDGLSKSDIAAELGLSRFKVSRLLDAARRDGIVRITIDVPADLDVDLSSALADAYGIRQAIVVTALDSSADFARLQVGRACAAVLSDSLSTQDVLGISWGRTLHAMVGALGSLPQCSVVQLVGALTNDLNVNSLELVRQVAEASGGPVFPLSVPMLLDSAEAARALRAEGQVRRTVRRFADVTTAVVGIGSWDPADSALEAALPRNLARATRRAGVVADVCACLIGRDGERVVVDELEQRLIAIDWPVLSRIPDVIAVAAGASKAPGIAAALRSGLVHRLITDQRAALELLDLAD